MPLLTFLQVADSDSDFDIEDYEDLAELWDHLEDWRIPTVRFVEAIKQPTDFVFSAPAVRTEEDEVEAEDEDAGEDEDDEDDDDDDVEHDDEDEGENEDEGEHEGENECFVQ
jgi:hypothetical protein